EQVVGPLATDTDAVDAGLGSLLHRYLTAFSNSTSPAPARSPRAGAVRTPVTSRPGEGCRVDELLRGLLAGQRLLGDTEVDDAVSLVEHVAGINSQAARALHLGLAARGLLDPLPVCDAALDGHRLVRANLTRGTLRTVSAADYRAWRPALQPVLERVTRGFLGRRLAEMPLDAVLGDARALLGQEPLDRADLGRALAARFPDHAGDGAGKDLAFAARMLLPLVQEPAAGCWEPQRRPRYLLAEQVVGPLATDTDAVDAGLGSLLHRYLTAFGPATLADFRAWSGVSADEAKRALALLPDREELAERSIDGTSYLSLPPDGACESAGGPPDVLLLPPFDDVLFGHADRGRVATRDQLKRLVPPAVEMPGIVLVQGRAAGRWRHRPAKRAADQPSLEVHLFPEAGAPEPALTAAVESLAGLLAADGRSPQVVVDVWPG
ncbi:MAG TPA: winged helix DNA-binding domain-containing protein, partial [Motilibacteraceae bacterium]|nr:winged helix DNA-binding domain-containing protein [Motilibacteraceae bacterium]